MHPALDGLERVETGCIHAGDLIWNDESKTVSTFSVGVHHLYMGYPIKCLASIIMIYRKPKFSVTKKFSVNEYHSTVLPLP